MHRLGQQPVRRAAGHLDQELQHLRLGQGPGLGVEIGERRQGRRLLRDVERSVEGHRLLRRLRGGKVSPDDISMPDLPALAPSYKIRIRVAKTLSGDSDVITVANDALDVAETELKDAQEAYNSLLNTSAADRVLKARAMGLPEGDTSTLEE